MHDGGGAYGHGGMCPPPPPHGSVLGRGDGYGHYGGGYGGHRAQGYGGGMGKGHTAYGAAGVRAGAGPSSVLEDQLLGIYTGRLPAGGGYDDLPLGRGRRCRGLWWLRRHGPLWWCCTGTWNAYDQWRCRARRCARRWRIRVRRREPIVPRCVLYPLR
jgi:hypothetical protein